MYHSIRIKLNYSQVLLFFSVSFSLCFSSQLQAFSPYVSITGWPLHPLEKVAPPSWLGDDPVLGRLICPPFSRLNLAKNSSEGLIFSDVHVNKDSSSSQTTWKYKLRSGIFWWNGQMVNTKDIAAFLTSEIPKVATDKSAGLWALPPFNVTHSEKEVAVHWKTAPAFGPYLLNGRSLWRAVKSNSNNSKADSYECAGVYKPSPVSSGMSLEATPGYRTRRLPVFFQTDLNDRQIHSSVRQSYDFKMAETFSSMPTKRPPDKPAYCPNKINMPYLSVISWNLEQKKLQDPSFRHVLTGLTPRGALLRAGAGFAGDLQSSLIPRFHPGYQSSVYVRPYDLEDSSKALDKLSYKRPQGDKIRLDENQKPLELKLLVNQKDYSIVEKALSDSFMAVGIKVKLGLAKEEFGSEGIDGVITGTYLPWPELNFLPDFHSKSRENFPFWSPKDNILDNLLEKYALSLTSKKPDFDLLSKIHRRLFNLETITVLMQHNSCLHVKNTALTDSINVGDPDWFRKIIL